MKKLKAIVAIVLLIVVVIFAVENAATVEIQFLAWSFSAPRALMVVGLLAIGFVIGVIASGLSTLRNRDDGQHDK